MKEIKEILVILGAGFSLMLTICLIMLFIIWVNSVNIPLERMAILFFCFSIFCFIFANIIRKYEIKKENDKYVKESTHNEEYIRRDIAEEVVAGILWQNRKGVEYIDSFKVKAKKILNNAIDANTT